MGLKENILLLRRAGTTYNEIALKLGCSKANISYHCRRMGMGVDNKRILSDNEIVEMSEYYKTHSRKETASKYKISGSMVSKYSTYRKDRKVKTETERRVDNYLRMKTAKQKTKIKAVEYKGGKCMKCGYSKCIRALDFHHNNPEEKDFSISSYKTYAWDKVKKELDKCVLVCSNCHREIHEQIYLDKVKKMIESQDFTKITTIDLAKINNE